MATDLPRPQISITAVIDLRRCRRQRRLSPSACSDENSHTLVSFAGLPNLLKPLHGLAMCNPLPCVLDDPPAFCDVLCRENAQTMNGGASHAEPPIFVARIERPLFS